MLNRFAFVVAKSSKRQIFILSSMAVNLHLHDIIQNPKIVQPYIISLFYSQKILLSREPFYLNFQPEQSITLMEVPNEPVTLESFPYPLQNLNCVYGLCL